MTYYVSTKNIRDILNKAILSNIDNDDNFDKYLHNILNKITKKEIWIAATNLNSAKTFDKWIKSTEVKNKKAAGIQRLKPLECHLESVLQSIPQKKAE